MITNKNEYFSTKSLLERFQTAVNKFDIDAVARKNGSRILAEAELRALQSQIDEFKGEIRTYELNQIPGNQTTELL
jgi:hypothetical protein